jgi:hypothetical protein
MWSIAANPLQPTHLKTLPPSPNPTGPSSIINNKQFLLMELLREAPRTCHESTNITFLATSLQCSGNSTQKRTSTVSSQFSRGLKTTDQWLYRSGSLIVWYYTSYNILTLSPGGEFLLRTNKNNSWFQVSQSCFIWVGRSEKHFIFKNILSQVYNNGITRKLHVFCKKQTHQGVFVFFQP